MISKIHHALIAILLIFAPTIEAKSKKPLILTSLPKVLKRDWIDMSLAGISIIVTSIRVGRLLLVDKTPKPKKFPEVLADKKLKEIRPAVENDIPQMLALRQHVAIKFFKPQVLKCNDYKDADSKFVEIIRNGGFENNIKFYQDRFGWAVKQENGWRLIGAFNQANQPLGLILYNVEEKKAQGIGVLQFFIVHEAVRSQGVGKQLLEKLWEITKKENPDIKTWQVTTMKWNNEPAIGFYKKSGFTEVVEEKKRPADLKSYHLLFERNVENPSAT